jgi:hypothetical protein
MVAAALMTSAEQKTAPVNDIGGEENAVMTTTTTKTHVDDASVVKVEEQRKIERLAKEEAGMEETMCRNEIASTSLTSKSNSRKGKLGNCLLRRNSGTLRRFASGEKTRRR